MMSFASLFILLIFVGCIVGVMSGLVGITGAFIIVPVGSFCLVSLGFPEEVAMRTAIATSLFIVMPTAVAGAWIHFKNGNIRTETAIAAGLTGLVFSYAGSNISEHLSAGNLSLLFGLVYIASSLAVLLTTNARSRETAKTKAIYAPVFGMIVGLIAGTTGIGGGVILIPLFLILLKFPAEKAIGTATAVVVMTSLGGILGYVSGGIGVEDLPPYSIGYLNVPMLMCIGITAIPATLLSAKAAPRVGAGRLRILFLLATLCIGIYYVFVRSGLFY